MRPNSMLFPISTPKPDSPDDLIGYIDSSGHAVVPPKYEAGHHFFEGVASVLERDRRWSFIDERGEIAISLRFDWIHDFHNGLCRASTKSVRGFINHSGEWCIQHRFLIASDFDEGAAYVSPDGETFGYIERSGRLFIKPQFEGARRFSCRLAAVCKGGYWGYIDRGGKTRIPFQFDGPRAQPFTNGLAGVRYRGQWGFIDTWGDWAVNPEYQDLGRFSEGYAPVCLDGKWGLVDLTGKLQFAPQYDTLGELDRGMAAASKDGLAGYLGPDGKWLIPPEYDECFRFWGELAAVRKGDRYLYIQPNGQIVWRSRPGAMVPSPPFVE